MKDHNGQIVIMIDELAGLLQGCDSQNPDLDYLEILNHIIDFADETESILALGVNRDLLFSNQKPLFRDIKNDDFDLILEINRNSAGYNQRDVHGQLQVT